MKEPNVRYTVGTISTKDIDLYKRTRNLQKDHTMEYIFKKGIEAVEQESIDNLTQNNTS